MVTWQVALQNVILFIIAGLLSSLSLLLAARYGKAAAGVAAVLDGLARKLEVMPVGGGSGVTGRYTVLAWVGTQALPSWSQQQSSLSDGELASARWNSCGETCVAMIIAAVWGVPVAPDSVRAELEGPSGDGLTTGANLVAALRTNNITAATFQDGGLECWDRVAAAGLDGRPCIILGTWPTPGGALHWLLTTGCSGEHLNYINPWGGVRSWVDRATFLKCYAGSVVEVNSHLHVDASHMLLPL